MTANDSNIKALKYSSKLASLFCSALTRVLAVIIITERNDTLKITGNIMGVV